MESILIVGIAAVLFGNLLTVLFIYAIVRIKRNEHDRPAVFILLFCLFAIGAVGFGLREIRQEQTTIQTYSTR